MLTGEEARGDCANDVTDTGSSPGTAVRAELREESIARISVTAWLAEGMGDLSGKAQLLHWRAA